MVARRSVWLARRAEIGPVKKALFITSVFPPEEGGGTIRVAKLAKYLPLFDWQLTVVTAKPPKTETTAEATSFPATKVYRAPRFDIARSLAGPAKVIRKLALLSNRWRRRINSTMVLNSETQPESSITMAPRGRLAEYIFIPDDRAPWMPLAIALGAWSIVIDRPSILYSTSPSPSTLLVGYVLRYIFRLPWIVEFRDPWMLNPFRRHRPIKWMEQFEVWLERVVLSGATHIVVTSPQYKNDLLARYPQRSSDSITYIPNGFDPEDFKDVIPQHFDKFTVVHAGNFYGARSSRPFLTALHMAIEMHPSMKERLQVLFVGQHDPATEQAITELGLGRIVQQIGVVPHIKSIEFIMGADILLLVPGPGNGTMPGKTFEYLAGRKPILALTDEGTVSELITSTETGEVVAPHDALAISKALTRLFTICTSPGGYPYPAANASDSLKQFDRKEIASRTARLMDALT